MTNNEKQKTVKHVTKNQYWLKNVKCSILNNGPILYLRNFVG